MKRNSERAWFDEGYKQGYKDSKIERFTPKIIGFWFLLIITHFSPSVAIVILLIYTLLEYTEHKDRKDYIKMGPPKEWEV